MSEKLKPIQYYRNWRKWRDYKEAGHDQIYNGVMKLRQVGYTDDEIINTTRILIDKLPQLEGADEQ